MPAKVKSANTARDGNIAIREELDLARKKNTEAALKLFIARHPDHPLSREAQAALSQLQNKNKNTDN